MLKISTMKYALAAAMASATVSAAFAASNTRQEGGAAMMQAEIPLNTGSVADMPPETSFIGFDGKRTLRNISRATITPVLPRRGTGNGAAVLILPGGAFAMLSMENEGWSVARWFAGHGVTAFVVKYRLNPTAAKQSEFDAYIAEQIKKIIEGTPQAEIPVPQQSIEDGQGALRYVKANAQKYGVDPRRIGMIGFSAGAMTTLSVVGSVSARDQPAFIAPIYPPMQAMAVPPSAPPMFVAIASDDPLFGKQGFGLVESWQAAGKPVELHFYQKGGHGFGAGQPDMTVSDWQPSFLHWMQMNGFLKTGK